MSRGFTQAFVISVSLLSNIVFAAASHEISAPRESPSIGLSLASGGHEAGKNHEENAAIRIPIYLSENSLVHLGGAKSEGDLNKFVKDNMHRKVRSVWLTKIPAVGEGAKLGMHHHEYDRLLLALDSVKLEVNYGKMDGKKLIELPAKQKKYEFTADKVYFLERDASGIMHNDVNVSSHPFNAIVVELE